MDEARHDSLYELDIALGLIPPPGGRNPPRHGWSTGCLRNLLTDVERQYPPHRDLHRQAILAGRTGEAYWGLWSFAASRCRLTHA